MYTVSIVSPCAGKRSANHDGKSRLVHRLPRISDPVLGALLCLDIAKRRTTHAFHLCCRLYVLTTIV